jgi:hypothetical protein
VSRPTKLNDITERAICDNIRLGLTYKASAEAAGVSYAVFNEWMKDIRPHYVKFQEAVSRANAEARKILTMRIQSAATDDWRAAAWMLERRFRDEYGQAVDVTSGGEKITENIVRLIIHEDKEDGNSA